MDFNVALQGFIVSMVIPLATELVKKFGNWNLPFISLLVVVALSMGSAFGLSKLLHPDMTTGQVIVLGALTAFEAVVWKVGDKSLPTSLIKKITGNTVKTIKK